MSRSFSEKVPKYSLTASEAAQTLAKNARAPRLQCVGGQVTLTVDDGILVPWRREINEPRPWAGKGGVGARAPIHQSPARHRGAGGAGCLPGARLASNHLRQIRTPRVTLVAHARGALARAVGGERVEPRDDRAVAAMLIDEPVQRIATEATAFRTLDPHDRQLAERSANVMPSGGHRNVC